MKRDLLAIWRSVVEDFVHPDWHQIFGVIMALAGVMAFYAMAIVLWPVARCLLSVLTGYRF
jgi:hypothetical protein